MIGEDPAPPPPPEVAEGQLKRRRARPRLRVAHPRRGPPRARARGRAAPPRRRGRRRATSRAVASRGSRRSRPRPSSDRWPWSATQLELACGSAAASQRPWAGGTIRSAVPCQMRMSPADVARRRSPTASRTRGRRRPSPRRCRAGPRRMQAWRQVEYGVVGRGAGRRRTTSDSSASAISSGAAPSIDSRSASSAASACSRPSCMQAELLDVRLAHAGRPVEALGVVRRDAGRRDADRDAVAEQRRAGERVRPAARVAPDGEPVDAERRRATAALSAATSATVRPGCGVDAAVAGAAEAEQPHAGRPRTLGPPRRQTGASRACRCGTAAATRRVAGLEAVELPAVVERDRERRARGQS